MKLYIFMAGTITTPNRGANTPGYGDGEKFTFPVPVYVIEHPEGLVVVDTGFKKENWPEFMRGDSDPAVEMSADKMVESLGYTTDDVKYVIMSHLHLDHAGGMDLFPNATFIVRKSELQYAWWPNNRGLCGDGYVFGDYCGTRNFNFIEVDDEVEYDVFGDGKIITIDTKGHTRGLQSVVLDLENSGKMVLATDTVGLKENLLYRVQAGKNLWNAEESLKAIDKMTEMQKQGATILMGHEPDQWKELKKAPEFYD